MSICQYCKNAFACAIHDCYTASESDSDCNDSKSSSSEDEDQLAKKIVCKYCLIEFGTQEDLDEHKKEFSKSSVIVDRLADQLSNLKLNDVSTVETVV